MTARPPTSVAFFDVDETLITCKSMFDFLHHWLLSKGYGPDAAALGVQESRDMVEGLDRAQANRAFYLQFAGERWSELLDAGESWFATKLDEGRMFHEDVLADLRRHREAGHAVVLVSGSFRPCLDPLARHCGARAVECSEMVISNGRTTGEIVRPMIGREKRAAVERHATTAEIRARCFAYADHPSDLDMMLAVGRPVLVGDDAELSAMAERLAWRRLTGTISSA